MKVAEVNLRTAYDRFLDRVVQKMTPEEILAYQLSEEEQDRADELMDRNNEGELTAEEKLELQQLAQFDNFMALLKAKALYQMSHK